MNDITVVLYYYSSPLAHRLFFMSCFRNAYWKYSAHWNNTSGYMNKLIFRIWHNDLTHFMVDIVSSERWIDLNKRIRMLLIVIIVLNIILLEADSFFFGFITYVIEVLCTLTLKINTLLSFTVHLLLFNDLISCQLIWLTFDILYL